MADFDVSFFIEVLVGGLLSGVMYALVAIGFVLIYKTSGVLNFAQGPLLLFAALTYVSLVERAVAAPLALVIVFAAMALIGIAIERTVLTPLANRPPITVFMATLGLAYVVRGAAQLLWGAQVHALDLGVSDTPFDVYGVFVSKFDLFAAGVAGPDGRGPDRLLPIHPRRALVPRGRRRFLRRRGDRPAACTRILATAWIAAGFVALVAGLLWGARLGVQFSLSLVVLKALPVLVLGGFDFDPRRDRRRPHRRRNREARRSLCRAVLRRRHRDLVRLCGRTGLPAGLARGSVRPRPGGESLT